MIDASYIYNSLNEYEKRLFKMIKDYFEKHACTFKVELLQSHSSEKSIYSLFYTWFNKSSRTFEFTPNRKLLATAIAGAAAKSNILLNETLIDNVTLAYTRYSKMSFEKQLNSARV